MDDGREKMARKRHCAGLCLDRRQPNEQRAMRWGVRGAVRGLILFRSADLAMGRDGWKWIIICLDGAEATGR